MTDLQLDPEQLERSATRHHDMTEDIDDVLDDVPVSVDAGVQSTIVAEMIAWVHDAAAATSDLHDLYGQILEMIADDTRQSDEEVAEMFTDLDPA